MAKKWAYSGSKGAFTVLFLKETVEVMSNKTDNGTNCKYCGVIIFSS